MQFGDRVDPVDLLYEDRLGERAGTVGVETDLLRPLADDVDPVGQPRRVEAHLDGDRIEQRREDRSPAHLVLALGGLGVGDLLAVELEAGQLFGGAGDDHRTPAVADGQHRRQHRAHVGGELVEQLGDALRCDVGDRHHGRAVAGGGDTAAARHQGAGRADQLGQREQLDVLSAVGPERFDTQHTLGVAGQRHRRRSGEIEALAAQRADGGGLRQEHPGHRHRRRCQMGGRGRVLAGRQRAHPRQRMEADRAHHDKLIGQRFQ